MLFNAFLSSSVRFRILPPLTVVRLSLSIRGPLKTRSFFRELIPSFLPQLASKCIFPWGVIPPVIPLGVLFLVFFELSTNDVHHFSSRSWPGEVLIPCRCFRPGFEISARVVLPGFYFALVLPPPSPRLIDEASVPLSPAKCGGCPAPRFIFGPSLFSVHPLLCLRD